MRIWYAGQWWGWWTLAVRGCIGRRSPWSCSCGSIASSTVSQNLLRITLHNLCHKCCTLHPLCFVTHAVQRLLIIHQFLYPCANLPLQFFNLITCPSHLINFTHIIIIDNQFCCIFLTFILYIFFSFILTMFNLCQFFLQFSYQSISMSLWILLTCANCIT